MAGRRFTTVLIQDDQSTGCAIQLPFDPKEAFGKVRAPVKATINGYTFRTTTCSMGCGYWIPVNRSNREGARIQAGDRITVRLELDTEPRVITLPSDFAKSLKANKKAWAAWETLSYTHRKEHVRAIEEAKRPETRRRRIEKAVEILAGRMPASRRHTRTK